MSISLSVENLSKAYRLGQIGTGTFANDLKVWWAKARGRSNPLLKIGESDHGNRDGEDVWALKDVSFTVGQGEVLGIIGRNGAGKSTLLKILSRITAPTSGQVKVRGRIASLLEVGTGFHPELTGRENIFLNGAILGMQRLEIARKFDEIVDFSGVEKFIDTPVKRYSSGMYVRLAFAVAAHLEPEILLVDEVLAVGDAEFQKKCLGKMGEVAREGRTVLFVSHNMGAITALCDDAILLDQGKVVEMDATKKVVDKYQNTMNFDPREGIRARSDRKGSGSFRFSNVLFGHNATPNAVLRSGQEVSIEIELYSVNNNPIEKAEIALIFKDIYGNILFTCLSRFKNVVFYDIKPRNKLVCQIHSLPLVPGYYQVDLWSADSQGAADIVENAFRIEVIGDDFFGSGQLPIAGKHGPILVDQDWSMIP